MDLGHRIALLERLGNYLQSDDETLEEVKLKAERENGWFVQDFINEAIDNICSQFLQADALATWTNQYQVPEQNAHPKKLGIVMAGNIPLVGFHDFLCGFITGQQVIIKPSTKDLVLIKHIVEKLTSWNNEVKELVQFADHLKGCDAYIATGSNNTGRYFEYYFRNYPSIIRKNRTSAAVLTGSETDAQLLDLADDILLYFGLGCRNVSKLYVPCGYNFQPLLGSFEKYRWMADHNKLKNNYDYNLSLHLLNYKFYMTNGILLLIENTPLFSPISQVNYEYYDEDPSELIKTQFADELQCLVGPGNLPPGQAQIPSLTDYADGVDSMAFVVNL
jgi:hypothetical protein